MSTLHLTLLHTNDLHGRVKQVARIGTLVRRIKDAVNSTGVTCLYLDAGDSEDSILLESAFTQGSAMDAILRGAGCDQVALGNAIPTRYGIQAIEKLAESFGKPLLCGNMYWKDGLIPPGLKPYVIEELEEYKLGIIGLTAPVDAYKIFNAEVQLPEESAPALIEQVRDEGADLVILLSHLGLKNDIRLAEKVNGISVIIGGHSHDRIKTPLLINDTLIEMAGELGEILGRLNLEIDPTSSKVTYCYEQHIPVNEQTPEDKYVLKVIDKEKQRARQMMNIEIGVLLEPQELTEDKECRAGNLLADALLEHFPGAQASFVMGEHWEKGLDAGALTKGQLYDANRSTGNPAKVELTGGQLEQFFLAALKPENMTKPLPVLRGRVPGLPHVAGMQVIAYGSEPYRVEIFIDNRLVTAEERVTVVTSDLEISGYLNYLVIPDEEVVYDVPTILPEVVEAYIHRHSPLGNVGVGRITFAE